MPPKSGGGGRVKQRELIREEGVWVAAQDKQRELTSSSRMSTLLLQSEQQQYNAMQGAACFYNPALTL